MVTHAQATARSRRTPGQLLAISLFWLALNFHWQALGLIIASQVLGLLYREASTGGGAANWVTTAAPVALALVSVLGLLIALIPNPLFGLLSDRTQGRLGRRTPYILGGTALNLVGLAVMALGPGAVGGGHSGSYFAPSLIVLTLGLMLTQLANNAAAAPFHALLPDTVPTEQRGTASGIMGLAQLFGSIGGALAPALFGFNSRLLLEGKQSYQDYSSRLLGAYALVAAVMLALALLSAATVREAPYTRPRGEAPAEGERMARMWRTLAATVVVVIAIVALSAAAIHRFGRFGANAQSDATTIQVVQFIAVIAASIGAARAFEFSLRRHPDFGWVLATHLLTMMGVYIVYSFLVYYLQFVARAPNPQAAYSTFITILTLAATLSTVIAGRASDRLGRKRMVYISGGLMAVVGAAFVFAPLVVAGSILPVMYGAGAVFGLGYGAYLAVDWALVADVLPSKDTYARDMGVWNMVYTIPSALALVLGAWLIALGTRLGSLTLGYTLLFVAFPLFAILGTVTVRYIRGAT